MKILPKGNKKYRAGISIDKVWDSFKIPNRVARRCFSSKPISTDRGEVIVSDVKSIMQDFKEHEKNQENITTPREDNNFPVTDLKEMKIYNTPDKDFKSCFKEA